MGCDSFGILEWNKDDARFAWRPEPEDQN
jgi:hypothetical protein